MLQIIELHMHGRMSRAALISQEFRLEDINDGIAVTRDGKVLRSLVDFGVAE